MLATALSGKPSPHPTLGNHTDGYQGCLRHYAHLLHCFLRNGLPCPSRKHFQISADCLRRRSSLTLPSKNACSTS